MDQLYQASVTTPPGVSPSLPQQTPFLLDDAILTTITIIIPDGHAGLTGIRIMQALQEIIPWSNNDWLVSNNEIVTVSVNTQVTQQGLVIETYNSDVFEHRHWVRAAISPLGTAASSATTNIQLIPSTQLSSIGL